MSGDNADLKHRLPHIRTLAMLKMEKNYIAHIEKGCPRQPYSFASHSTSFLILRIEEELRELKDAFRDLNLQVMREECADISNLVDYLFEHLTQYIYHQRNQPKKK